jgi:predicted dehydrogenase
VLVVGLGTIARTHLAVLARRADVRVVGGVDPRVPGALPFPVHRDLDEALAGGSEPDVVVVATPTDTHVDLVAELLTRTDALVLSEKPLARTRAGIEAVRATQPQATLDGRLKVTHHFAFSPEVEWARATFLAHPEWGPPTRVVSVFNDAYAGLPAARRAGYVSTWVDSAPNQLSLLAPFVTGWSVAAHADRGDRAVTVLDHQGGRTVLTSNWLAADTSKQTVREFHGGAVELRMDHTSMTGLLLEDGRVVENAAYAGDDTRKDAHYLGVYDVLLSRPDDERLGVPLDRKSVV